MVKEKEKKAERINERLLKGEIGINDARSKYGLKPIIHVNDITKVQPDSNKGLD